MDTTVTGDGDSIKVFLRVRPPAKDVSEYDHGTCLEVDSEKNIIRMNCRPEPKVFTFDQVADANTAQETVFGAVGKKITESCFGGYNGTIFAYGQTGSGKTFTMLGPADNTENFQHEMRGVIPRSFEYLFNLIKKEQELNGDKVQFLCKCSFLEIYNEQVFDLLDPASRGLQLRENIKRGVFVDGLIEEAVCDAGEAYDVLTSGWLNRTVASTAMNRESSRSHAVFTIHIESKVNNNGVWNVKCSQLNLVDLAGSERQKDTQTVGLRLKEATSINKSLSTLGNVIMALVDITHGKTRHVPYRDSKLSFLLRDSLGGNAKTHIIACVHPGSKSFGETLSTLQFARRAKMIKNKAVVNEDMHGNVSNLQAEIRKLKDIISKYEMGSIPMVPSSTDGNIGDNEMTIGSTCEGQWKQSFIEAMHFRDQVITEKRVMCEKYKRLEELCNRKEQAIRQNKMILKFREDAIRKYEKAHKDKANLSNDDTNDIINSLRGEIRVWEESMKHHPEVAQCKVEIENLRSEVKQLRSQQSAFDNQRISQLEKTFSELMSRKEKDRLRAAAGDSRITVTPPTSADSTLSVATIERHKSQITKLQTEVEHLHRDLQAQRQDSEKNVIDMSAELVSLRKAKEELEKTLKAYHIRSQADRETFEELHIETLKTMTTPKKTRYRLRNRNIMGPASARQDDTNMGELLLNRSLSEDDLITMQGMPQEISEEKIEALTDEIKKLQEENRILHAQMDNHESEIIHQVEETSRLECQTQLGEERQERERNVWKTHKKQLDEEISVLSAKLKTLQQDRDVVQGEVLDLRIMYEASAKGNKDLRVQVDKLKECREKEVAVLETKKMKLEVELAKVQRELQVAQEDQTTWKETEENLQATLNFTQEKLQQAEGSLIEATKANQELESKLYAAQTRLHLEEGKNHQLCTQLQKEGDKEEKLVEAMSRIEHLEEELELSENMTDASVKKVQVLEVDLQDAREQVEKLVTANQEKNDMINSLSMTIGKNREVLLENDRMIELLSTQKVELTAANNDLVVENDKLRQENDDLGLRYDQETNQLTLELQKAIGQLDVLQDDMDENLETNASLESELVAAKERNNEMTLQIQENQTHVEDLKHQNSYLSKTISDMKQSLDSATAFPPHSPQKEAQPHENLRTSFRKYKESFELLSEQRDALDTENAALKQRVSDLKEQVSSLEKQVSEVNRETDSLREQADTEYNMHRDRELEWQMKVQEMEETAQFSVKSVKTAIVAKEVAENKANIVHEENTRLNDALDNIGAEIGELEHEVLRLRNILEDKQRESEEYQQRIELLSTDKNNLEKAYKELLEKFTVVENEVALLSGHQNNKQKIKYVTKLHEDKIELLQKYNTLLGNYTKLKVKFDVLVQDVDSRRGTPTKRLAHLSGQVGGSPIRKDQDTPKKLVSTAKREQDTPSRLVPARSPLARKEPDTPNKMASIENPFVKQEVDMHKVAPARSPLAKKECGMLNKEVVLPSIVIKEHSATPLKEKALFVSNSPTPDDNKLDTKENDEPDV